MNLLGKLNINLRFSLIIGLIAVVSFSIIASIMYFSISKNTYNNNEEYIESEILNYNKIIDNQRIKDFQEAKTAINTFDFLFRKMNNLVSTDEEMYIEAINISTFEISDLTISNWYLNNKKLYNNNKTVDKISAITDCFAAIYQKTPEGYLSISSNLVDNQGEYCINYLVPNSSEMVYIIENGDIYLGFENYFSIDYLVAAKPIYLEGEIKGMICVYYKDELISSIKKFFENKTYHQNGFPFIVNEEGLVKIHPILENTSIRNTNLFEKISKSKKSEKTISTNYIWPEDKNGIDKKLHVLHSDENKLFIGISYFTKDFERNLVYIKLGFIASVIISTLIVVIIVFISMKLITNKIKLINHDLYQISQGKIIDEKEVIKNNDEIFQANFHINEIIKYLSEIHTITENINNYNLDKKHKVISKYDTIGYNLIEIQERIIKSKETEEKIKAEEKIKKWTNEGINKFIEITRFNNENLEQLSYNLISNLVSYLGAVQGGFFIYEEKFLNMTACFAYDKQKIMQNKISIDSGLLGRVVKEKKYIYLNEIPDNYVNITSGLGETRPKYLLITPLIFGNDIIGVIEIASIKEFENYHIDFVNNIGENIASTISNLKNNKRTELLLRKSQEQSRIMENQKEEMEKNILQLKNLKKDTDLREIEMQNIFKAIDSTALVAEFDTYGKIISINDKFLKTIDQDREQIIGKYHKNITSINTDTEEYRQFWNDLSNGKARNLIEALNINERTTWLSQTYTPILDKSNKVYKILNIALDITENKRLEKELRSQVREMNRQEREILKEKKNIDKQQKEIEEKDNKLNFLLTSIDFSFIRIEYGIQGIILSVNTKFVDYYGYKIEDILGKNIHHIFIFDDENRYLLILSKIKKGLVVEEEAKCLSKNGKLINFKITFSPIKNEEKIVTKVLLVGAEIKN